MRTPYLMMHSDLGRARIDLPTQSDEVELFPGIRLGVDAGLLETQQRAREVAPTIRSYCFAPEGMMPQFAAMEKGASDMHANHVFKVLLCFAVQDAHNHYHEACFGRWMIQPDDATKELEALREERLRRAKESGRAGDGEMDDAEEDQAEGSEQEDGEEDDEGAGEEDGDRRSDDEEESSNESGSDNSSRVGSSSSSSSDGERYTEGARGLPTYVHASLPPSQAQRAAGRDATKPIGEPWYQVRDIGDVLHSPALWPKHLSDQHATCLSFLLADEDVHGR